MPSMRVAMTMEQCWHRVPGGTAVAAIGMAKALDTDPRVDVVGVAALHRAPPHPPFTPPVDVRHLLLPRPALYDAWHRWRWPRVDFAVGAIDVIHATTIAMPPRSAPIVITIHDLAFVKNPSHFTKRGVRFFNRGLELALEEADVVVCPSEATLRDCREQGFSPQRLRLVPMGIDQEPASKEQVEGVKRRYRLPDRYVLWTGTIEPRKNLPALLSAFRDIDADVDLVLAGPRGWHEDIGALVSSQRDRIKLLGFVPRAHLGALYAGARAFCFPSLLEGFGLPVLEAMAQGTPVVTSLGTSTEELARGAGVLVDPYDPSSIASGLKQVLEDEELAAEMARAGKQRAAAYTWDKTAHLLVEAYMDAVTTA